MLVPNKNISVTEAATLVLSEQRDYGTQLVTLHEAAGKVLAEELIADRDLPPFNRVAMDGIAVKYDAIEKNINEFIIKGIQQAGDEPQSFDLIEECIEIMTGAALPGCADTVIRYEDVQMNDGHARLLTTDIRKGQNIHTRGADKRSGDTIVNPGNVLTAAHVGVAASIGKTHILVKKFPKVLVISTGNELVAADQTPSPFQVRQSNAPSIQAALLSRGMEAQKIHLEDDAARIKSTIEQALLEHDLLILSGGISMGKYDHIPGVLNELGVKKIFHKVAQRPGKPFWFGSQGKKLIFAFPGNPVSAFLCMYRYFFPWLDHILGIKTNSFYAMLDEDISFNPALTLFKAVKLKFDHEAVLKASALPSNGSGDFCSLVDADAFIELPPEKKNFNKGEVYRIWPVKNILS
jgi:molybdopterin molybdotransferase